MDLSSVDVWREDGVQKINEQVISDCVIITETNKVGLCVEG